MKTKAEIEQWCVAYVARALNAPIARIDPQADFESFGLDSTTSVAMIVELEEALGRDISPTLLFEHRTLARIAEHLKATA